MNQTEGVKNSKLKITLQVVSIIVLFFISFFFIKKKLFSSTIKIILTPSDASVYINDKQIKNPASTQIYPGKYTVKVQREGFGSESQELSILPHETKTLYFSLSSNTEELYRVDEEDEIEDEDISIQLFDAEMEKILSEYPKLNLLPIYTTIYSLRYEPCYDAIKPCVIILSDLDKIMTALDRFRSLDPDLGKYQFEFESYTNPFKGENNGEQ